MSNDLALVLGLVLAVLSLPALVSALTDRRAPVAAGIVLVAGGALIVYALQSQPGGYEMRELPLVVARVVQGFLY